MSVMKRIKTLRIESVEKISFGNKNRQQNYERKEKKEADNQFEEFFNDSCRKMKEDDKWSLE